MQRYFGIGWNRTGTTSLKYAFDILGIRGAHWAQAGMFVQPMANEQDYDGIIEFIRKNKYQMYCDSPFYQESIIYRLDKEFPNSKYILTLRNPEKWVHSLKALWGEFRKRPTYRKNPGFIDIFGCSKITGNEEHFMKIFVERNEKMLAYFQNRPKDLLVLDMEKDELEWPKLCKFLNKDIPDSIFPHRSKTKRKH